MTYGEAVSRIQNDLNTLNKDMFIPRRFILSVLKSKAEFLMSQKFNDKSLFRETNLYKWVNCIKLEEVDTVKCGKIELKKCNIAMMSVDKIPDLIWSRYGPSVIMVTNITEDKEYILITPSQYLNNRKREGFEKLIGRYAIIHPDNRISIPDSTTTKINVLLYSLSEKLDSMSDCDGNDNECKSYWDSEFNVSSKIKDIVIQETIKEVSMRLNIPKDEQATGNSNQKTPNPN